MAFDDDPLQLSRPMPKKDFTASDITSMAKRAANLYIETGMPLGDAVVKVAEDYPALTQHHVRRLVEAANTAAFQNLFEKRAARGQKNVDFKIAEPEAVLAKMTDSSSVAPAMSADYSTDPVKIAHQKLEADIELCRAFGMEPQTVAMEKTAGFGGGKEHAAELQALIKQHGSTVAGIKAYNAKRKEKTAGIWDSLGQFVRNPTVQRHAVGGGLGALSGGLAAGEGSRIPGLFAGAAGGMLGSALPTGGPLLSAVLGGVAGGAQHDPYAEAASRQQEAMQQLADFERRRIEVEEELARRQMDAGAGLAQHEVQQRGQVAQSEMDAASGLLQRQFQEGSEIEQARQQAMAEGFKGAAMNYQMDVKDQQGRVYPVRMPATVAEEKAYRHRAAGGALGGTALGAGLGALLSRKDRGAGALIGAGLGALGGTSVGHNLGKSKAQGMFKERLQSYKKPTDAAAGAAPNVKQAMAYVKTGRPDSNLVVDDLRQGVSLAAIKRACADKNPDPEVNPFGRLVRTKQAIDQLAADAEFAVYKNDEMLKEAAVELGHLVSQELMNGSSLGEVAHALNSAVQDVDWVKIALDTVMPDLVARGVVNPVKEQSATIRYEMEKGASARVVNPDHPMIRAFGGLVKAAMAHQELSEAHEKLGVAKVELDREIATTFRMKRSA